MATTAPTAKLQSTRTALEFAYNARAAKPKKWLKRCKELWPDDPEQEALLQELFGYLLLLTSGFIVFSCSGEYRVEVRRQRQM